MTESPIYLRGGRMHTGHITETGLELAFQLTGVVNELKSGLARINPATSPFPAIAMSRVALGVATVGEKTKTRWSKARMRFNRVMEESRLFDSPKKMELKLSEHMIGHEQLQTTTDAQGFLNLAEARLAFLLSERAQSSLNTLIRAGLIFTEDYALRRAVFDGVIFSGAFRADKPI